MGGRVSSLVPCVVLVAEPRPKGATAESTGEWAFSQACSHNHGTMVCEPVTWVRVGFLKMTFLSLGLCWSLATSYLDPKASTKALLSADGCQVIVAVGGMGGAPPILSSCCKHFLSKYQDKV